MTPPTYVAGSVEKGAWDTLMHERATCGFGLLQQDSRLDFASAGHAFYLARNTVDQFTSYVGHAEDPAQHYFVGADPTARATAKGFPSASGAAVIEILAARTATYTSALPAQYATDEAAGRASIRTLLGTTYHVIGALQGGRVGGVGSDHALATRTSGGVTTTWEAYRIGVLNGLTDGNTQKLGTGNVATYPCAGATSAVTSWRPASESPSAFPDITDPAAVLGTPIYIKADSGVLMLVSSASITKVSDGSLVGFRQLSWSSDRNGLVNQNEWFLVPLSALEAGATYSVNVAGTLDGAAFTKTFRFTPSP